jgi:AraC family transcriptional regulator of adaptative response/methylated-DNA-[protein]-cysteine methyltransferase
MIGHMKNAMQLANEPETGRSARLDTDAAWQQVLARDPQAAFFYAVTTTGVVCRPSCASRRPLRENVRFFASVTAASAAGFRTCRRCKPEVAQADPMIAVRELIEAHVDQPLPLERLGRIAGLSPFTVQRLFKKQMGVSPLQYQRALKATRLRRELKQGGTVTEAIYEAGFGSSSRAYEGTGLGMTPARFARGGQGERIGFATAWSELGWVIAGATERGLCWLAIAASDAEAEATLRTEFPMAEIGRDAALEGMVRAAMASVAGGGAASREAGKAEAAGLPLDLRGTAFQLRVWQALRAIPRGETKTYSQLARELGNENATRAVARACALNRVSVVVPCHRVVGVSGSLTGYRWGMERKRRLLEMEKVI